MVCCSLSEYSVSDDFNKVDRLGVGRIGRNGQGRTTLGSLRRPVSKRGRRWRVGRTTKVTGVLCRAGRRNLGTHYSTEKSPSEEDQTTGMYGLIVILSVKFCVHKGRSL